MRRVRWRGKRARRGRTYLPEVVAAPWSCRRLSCDGRPGNAPADRGLAGRVHDLN